MLEQMFRLAIIPLLLLSLALSTISEAKGAISKDERQVALKTLRSYEKIYGQTLRLKTPKEAVNEVRRELFCTDQIIGKINRSKQIVDEDKFFYILAFIILFQADARSTLARSAESELLSLGSRLKARSVALEREAKTKRGQRIARGLLAQALMAEDYLRMPEANFCQEYQRLEKEGYNADSVFVAYINLVNWDMQEWATSPEFERAINMLYASFNPMFNAKPAFRLKRLRRFEDMHISAILPWVRKKKPKGVFSDLFSRDLLEKNTPARVLLFKKKSK